MRVKIYHAVFIGRDSCGFKNNHIYCIKVWLNTNGGYSWVYDQNSNARCPYSSIDTLNQNWHILENYTGFKI